MIFAPCCCDRVCNGAKDRAGARKAAVGTVLMTGDAFLSQLSQRNTKARAMKDPSEFVAKLREVNRFMPPVYRVTLADEDATGYFHPLPVPHTAHTMDFKEQRVTEEDFDRQNLSVRAPTFGEDHHSSKMEQHSSKMDRVANRSSSLDGRLLTTGYRGGSGVRVTRRYHATVEQVEGEGQRPHFSTTLEEVDARCRKMGEPVVFSSTISPEVRWGEGVKYDAEVFHKVVDNVVRQECAAVDGHAPNCCESPKAVHTVPCQEAPSTVRHPVLAEAQHPVVMPSFSYCHPSNDQYKAFYEPLKTQHYTRMTSSMVPVQTYTSTARPLLPVLVNQDSNLLWAKGLERLESRGDMQLPYQNVPFQDMAFSQTRGPVSRAF